MSFAVKREPDPFGERLIWRNAGHWDGIRRVLARAGVSEIPRSITVGYYREIDGAVAFVPARTPAAIASLDVEMVRDRIAEDLVIRLRASTPEAKKRARGHGLRE